MKKTITLTLIFTLLITITTAFTVTSINEQQPEQPIIESYFDHTPILVVLEEPIERHEEVQIQIGEEEARAFTEDNQIFAEAPPLETNQYQLQIELINQNTGETDTFTTQAEIEEIEEEPEIDEEILEQIAEDIEDVEELPEDIDEEDIQEILEEQEEALDFEEQTIDISEETEQIPGYAKWLIPEQKVNIHLEGLPEIAQETIPTEISITMDSELQEVEITHQTTENPTLEVWINEEALQDENLEPERIKHHIEKENIQIEAHGILNSITLFIGKTFIL